MAFPDYLGLLGANLAELLTVFMVLVILSGRREARATLGWLLLVIFVPYLGAFLYILFGRKRPEYPSVRPSIQDSQCAVPDATLPLLMTLTQKLTGLPPVCCREIELLPNAQEKYDRLFADIEAARHRIVLCYYVFRRDRTGTRLLELLARKAEQGVKVYLLFDGWGAFGLSLFGALHSYRSRGVRAEPFARVIDPLKMSRINFRNHRKIVVIDGDIAYTGSTNIGDEYLGLSPRFGTWHDLHMRLTGQASVDLEEVFVGDWKIATGESLSFTPSTAARGDIPVHVLPTGPDLAEDRLFPLLFAQVARARRTIDILAPYLVPNQGLIAALSVAARQGARVRLLLPRRSNHPLVAAAGRSYYEELIEGGVDIYETPNAMLHAKGVIVDGTWALLGSANFDNRSFFLNFEINVALSDSRFVTSVSQVFDEWSVSAEPVTIEQVRSRPFARRIFEAVCRTISPVL